MILTNADLSRIIGTRPNKKLIDTARDYSKKLLMHIKGIGLDAYIEKIMAFEKEDLIKIRKKYAVSNKAIFSRIHRPIDKIFSAKGGSVYFNLSDDSANRFKSIMSNVKYGYSLRQWLEIFWMPAFHFDPMGLILVEVDQQGNAYPTYKCINDIYEYEINGRNVEYVIFKVPSPLSTAVNSTDKPTGEYFRVIDDGFDRIVVNNNGVFTDVPDQTYPNYFMRVPASVISNIFDPSQGMFISPDDDIVELADQFLREGSVKNIYKNYFGFPKAWEYQQTCPECRGNKVLDGRQCDHCKGTGVKIKTDPSQTIFIPVPETASDAKIAPELGGYITPDINGWKMMSEELAALEDLMFETLWGTKQAEVAQNDTATGKFIDTQPVNDKLNKFSDAAEMMETFITDLIGEMLFGLSYKGASITYGRRFLIESADVIWQKLEDARKNGAPTIALYDLYNDYLQSRYSANAMEMNKLLKLAKIEPLPFVKYDEFAKMQTFPDVIIRQKFWFERWLCGKTDAFLLLTPLETLIQDFEKFCTQKEASLPPAPNSSPGQNSPILDPSNINQN